MSGMMRPYATHAVRATNSKSPVCASSEVSWLMRYPVSVHLNPRPDRARGPLFRAFLPRKTLSSQRALCLSEEGIITCRFGTPIVDPGSCTRSAIAACRVPSLERCEASNGRSLSLASLFPCLPPYGSNLLARHVILSDFTAVCSSALRVFGSTTSTGGSRSLTFTCCYCAPSVR